MARKKRIIRELREFGIIVAIFGVLYFTGLHTEVAAFAQRVVLATGVMNHSAEIENGEEAAVYDFKLINRKGEEFDFTTLKGKVVFLNFWASWCGPCLAEMPGIQKLYESVQDEPDLAFVLVSLDSDFNKAKRYVDKKDITVPIYTRNFKSYIPRVYSSRSIPTTFVITRDGKIANKKVGMANYNTGAFKKYLRKLANQR